MSFLRLLPGRLKAAGGGPVTYTLPSFIGAGAGVSTASNAVNLSPAYPTGTTGDLFLLHIVGRGQGHTIAEPITNWTKLGDRTFSGASHVWVFYRFHPGGSLTSPVIDWASSGGEPTGESIGARIYNWRNVDTGNPFVNFIPVEPSVGTGNTCPMPALTTARANSVNMFFSGYGNDMSVAAATGATGGTWVETVAEFVSTDGFDYTIHAQHANMATVGTITGGAVSLPSTTSRVGSGFTIQGKPA